MTFQDKSKEQNDCHIVDIDSNTSEQQQNTSTKERSSSSTSTKHFGILDSIRGISAILVVFFHARYFRVPGTKEIWIPYDNITWFGPLMVRWFFVLSAYLITYITLKRWSSTVKKTVDGRWYVRGLYYLGFWGNYWIARIARIYPLLMVLAYFITHYEFVASSYYKSTDSITWWEMVSLKTTPHVTWSLPTEIRYYAFIPIFVMVYYGATRTLVASNKQAVNKHYSRIAFIATWVFIIMQLVFPQIRVLNLSLGIDYLSSNGFTNHYAVFLGGSMAGAIQYEIDDGTFTSHWIWAKICHVLNKMKVFSIGSIVPLALTMYFDNVHFNNKKSPFFVNHNFEYDGILIGISFLCATNVQKTWLNQLLDSSILRFYGKISFAVYLLHPIFLYNVFLHVPKYLSYYTGDNNGFSIGLDCYVLSFLATTLISYISTTFFELPVLKISKKLDIVKLCQWIEKKYIQPEINYDRLTEEEI